jgi:hypothetical protein
MITYTDALLKLRPEALFTIVGDNYSTLEWYDEVQTKPTEEEIKSKVTELELEEQNSQYKQKRADEYPSIGDQLDALFHADVFPEDMAATIQAVKDKYPKTNTE